MSEDLSIDTPAETPAELTIGQKLQQARQNKGWNIVDASSHSKIKVSFLQFLENDEFDKLPNLLTAKGFAKVYAALLGLNVEEIVQQFNLQFPSEAGPEQGKEIKIGMTVDKRTLFPNGLKTMNRAGSITRTVRSRNTGRSKKSNKFFWRVILISTPIVLLLAILIFYLNSTMGDIKNTNLRQRSNTGLEAKDTPEATARKEYDKNKIYIEATALKDTYVTLTTIADDRPISQGFMLRRGDFKSWDGSQYIRLRSSVSKSLQLTVNGKNEGVLEESEKMFLTTAGEAELKIQEEKQEDNKLVVEAAAAPVRPGNDKRETSILENI